MSATTHSILLGTDGPSSNTSSTTKFLTPSTRILQATSVDAGKRGSLTELQRAALGLDDKDDKEKDDVDNTIEKLDIGFETSASTAKSSRDFTTAAVPSKSTSRQQAWTTSDDFPSSSSLSTTNSNSRPPLTLAADMAELMAAFGSVLNNVSNKTAVEEEKEQQQQQQQISSTIRTIHQYDSSLSSHSPSTATSTTASRSNIDSKTTVTCFDLVTSSATIIPFSKVIGSAAATTTTTNLSFLASSSSPIEETYVVITPIDWTIHHSDCTFARLTGINHAADASESIALELSTQLKKLQDVEQEKECEIEILKKQLAAKDRVIETQRQQIKELQAAAATHAATSATPATKVTNYAEAVSTILGASSASVKATKATAASSSSSDESKEDDDEESSDEDDMADEEDANL